MRSPYERWSSAPCYSSQQLQDKNTDKLNRVCHLQTRERKECMPLADSAALLVMSTQNKTSKT